MNLKESDYKLLSYLYHHYREPISKIAKETGLTREQVDYKLNKYAKEGLIKGFFTLFNYSKFGYDCFVTLLLKFERSSSVEKFISKLERSKNCISWGKVYGKYDLFLNCVFKNEKELNDFLSELISNRENPIAEHFIIKPYFAELYPLKFMKHKERINYIMIGDSAKEQKFDKKEIEILKILSKDGRARIVDIASKTNLSSELVLYKLRKLYRDKVIIGSRIQFDMGNLGYYFSLILLNVRNLSNENKGKIKKFAHSSEHVNSLIISLTRPNCIIQLFHKEEKELRHSIEEIKKLFKDEYIDMEIMPIGEDEIEINTLPFLWNKK